MSNSSIDFENHVVLLGWNDLAHRITRQLVLADKQVAVITRRTEVRELIRETFSPEQVQVHLSQLNDWSAFSRVNIEQSIKVFINLDSEEDSLVAILNLKALYDGLEFDVVLENPELEETFYAAGVTYAVATENVASKLTSSHLYKPEVATYTSDLLSASEKSGDHDVQQYELLDANEYVGQVWGDLFWDLKEQLNCVPIGLARPRPDDLRHDLTKVPPEDMQLQAGDYIVLITAAEKEADLESFFGTSEGIRR